uniref:RxLR effector candidate protein n=1 Tax=Hyaloperonospora arabidopsidis (strain Emoy2) TaxID=559515 RepID=M4BFK0_HYAAE
MFLLDWRDIRRVPGATSSMVQTLFRIKANKLNLWNIDRADWSCPHPTCDTSILASLQHVFWDCLVPATAWQEHRARWRAPGDNLDDNLQLTTSSLVRPDTPRKAWASIRNALGEIDDEHKYQDELYDGARLLWRLMALSTIHAIWCARHRLRLEEGATLATLWAIINRTVLSGVMQLRALVQEFDDCALPRSRVLSALATMLVQAHVNDAGESPRPLVVCSVYLLFFKGGW